MHASSGASTRRCGASASEGVLARAHAVRARTNTDNTLTRALRATTQRARAERSSARANVHAHARAVHAYVRNVHAHARACACAHVPPRARACPHRRTSLNEARAQTRPSRLRCYVLADVSGCCAGRAAALLARPAASRRCGDGRGCNGALHAACTDAWPIYAPPNKRHVHGRRSDDILARKERLICLQCMDCFCSSQMLTLHACLSMPA
eukprot:3338970-Pleurochrysis_carterae.AAC.1